MSREKLFENHIASYLQANHRYTVLKKENITDKDFHFLPEHIFSFLEATQQEVLEELNEIYGSGYKEEILRTLKEETKKKELWFIIRHGLMVKGKKIHLYFPKPRAFGKDTSNTNYSKNLFSFKTQYHFSKETEHSIDIVLFLNGLPVITIELKHVDENQTFEDAIEQYHLRDHKNKIFQFPFLHFAMDTEKVQVATSPPVRTKFRWFNSGLKNATDSQGEYNVEYIYKNVLSPDWILEYLEIFLVYSPAKEVVTSTGIEEVSHAYSIFPRYHQLRSTKNVSLDIQTHFENQKVLGKKYLIHHSAGSGKTLTISWLADKLNSLCNSKEEKIFEMIFILTDRRSLDKNIKEELKQFTHLENSIQFCRDSSELAKAIDLKKNIVVSTIQKFGYIQDKLKELNTNHFRIAFLIDEAHRSQEGKSEYNMRTVFRKPEEEDTDTEEKLEEEELLDKLQKLNIDNQVFIAFTATPTQKTINSFGNPFDSYMESEAIEEGYILDVADKIVSYSTLYNIKGKKNFTLPNDAEFPKVTLANALRNLAFRDESIILYKSTVIINHFLENVFTDLQGKAKAMVVTSSRPAGLIYFKTLKSIIEERKLPFKILFAFSDYRDEETKEEISEVKINQLDTLHKNEKIEEVFDKYEYRILVVANKFQTGFDQPKLTAMYLDKVIHDLTAVQTVSRLNRAYPGKESVSAIDFTNNTEQIFKAFSKYRYNVPHKFMQPDKSILDDLYNEVTSYGIFSIEDIQEYNSFDKKLEDAEKTKFTDKLRAKLSKIIPKEEEKKKFVNLLNKLTSAFYFLSKFFEIEKDVIEYCLFIDAIKDTLLKKTGSRMKEFLQQLYVERGAVREEGLKENPKKEYKPTETPRGAGGTPEIHKITIPAMLEEIKEKFQITKEEAIVLNDITMELESDSSVIEIVQANKQNELFLFGNYIKDLILKIKEKFYDKDMDDKLKLASYIEEGGIISLMARSIIQRLQYL
jgi:type I restriction enzyme, R subunit